VVAADRGLTAKGNATGVRWVGRRRLAMSAGARSWPFPDTPHSRSAHGFGPAAAEETQRPLLG
jgi:hypothetical protein